MSCRLPLILTLACVSLATAVAEYDTFYCLDLICHKNQYCDEVHRRCAMCTNVQCVTGEHHCSPYCRGLNKETTTADWHHGTTPAPDEDVSTILYAVGGITSPIIIVVIIFLIVRACRRRSRSIQLADVNQVTKDRILQEYLVATKCTEDGGNHTVVKELTDYDQKDEDSASTPQEDFNLTEFQMIGSATSNSLIDPNTKHIAEPKSCIKANTNERSMHNESLRDIKAHPFDNDTGSIVPSNSLL